MISLIAAMTAQKRVIGFKNKMPWNLPEDLKRFKRLTSGHMVIMGRKTFESIGRPLPNRENIVISRQNGFVVPGARVVGSLDQAFELQESPKDEVFVIGGAEIYRLALPHADRLYLTLIHKEFEGDAHFPDWESFAKWNILERVENQEGTLDTTYLTLKKI